MSQRLWRLLWWLMLAAVASGTGYILWGLVRYYVAQHINALG